MMKMTMVLVEECSLKQELVPTFHCGKMPKAFEAITKLPKALQNEIVGLVGVNTDCLDAILFYCFPEVGRKFTVALLGDDIGIDPEDNLVYLKDKNICIQHIFTLNEIEKMEEVITTEILRYLRKGWLYTEAEIKDFSRGIGGA